MNELQDIAKIDGFGESNFRRVQQFSTHFQFVPHCSTNSDDRIFAYCRSILNRVKVGGSLIALMLMVACQPNVTPSEPISDDDVVVIEYECAQVEGDEEVRIYDKCWSDVYRTPEGRAFIERYMEETRIAFPGGRFTRRDVTFGEIKEAFDQVLETCKLDAWEQQVCDTTAILEVGGVRIARWWQGTERMNYLLDKACDIFAGGGIGDGALLTFFEESLETDISDITINDLERAVRRSVEDGVDYILEALRNDEFIDPTERNQDE